MKNLLLLLFLPLFSAQIIAQCFPDRHNTTWYDGWVSCEASTNPNPERGQSHWLMYDFGHVYKMGQMHVWNTNDLEYLDWGLHTAIIDYSNDGNTWTNLGTFDFEQATGKNTYQGFDGPNFDGIDAQYVLITAVDNYGGDCYGLSEIRIRVDGTTIVDTEELDYTNQCLTVHLYPNPFVIRTQLKINTRCDDDVFYSLQDALGHRVISEQKLSGNSVNLEFSGQTMPAGVYFLSVRQGVEIKQYRLVKIGG